MTSSQVIAEIASFTADSFVQFMPILAFALGIVFVFRFLNKALS